MPAYAAAIDQGTTGTRFMVFDRQGRIVASKYEEHSQICPQPGWVEHDAAEVWANARAVISGAMEAGGVKAAEIAGIGVTNQRETTVVWDPTTGEPLSNAIVWQDTRTREICERLNAEGLRDKLHKKTGLLPETYFSGPKLQWMLANVPGLREKAEAGRAVFGNMDSWVIWNLTGGPDGGAHVTDATNASRTMLMDLRALEWDDGLLDLFGVPRAMLPSIRPSSDPEFYGKTRAAGPVGGVVPVSGALGDQQAALFGQTGFDAGDAENTYGTGCFMLLNTGAKPVGSGHGMLTTVAYGGPMGATYALEGSVAVAGSAVQWLRDEMKMIRSAAETEDLAQSVEDTGGVYFVPAFSGLFAPYWDMDARGVIVGLTGYAKRAHIVRATLEAICYQTRDVFEAMRRDSGVALSELRVGGGATVNNFLMQLQADILGIPVMRPKATEMTALGAAYAAGLAAGLWSGHDELRENWEEDRVFEPQWSDDRRDRAYAGWERAVERSRGWKTEKEGKTG